MIFLCVMLFFICFSLLLLCIQDEPIEELDVDEEMSEAQPMNLDTYAMGVNNAIPIQVKLYYMVCQLAMYGILCTIVCTVQNQLAEPLNEIQPLDMGASVNPSNSDDTQAINEKQLGGGVEAMRSIEMMDVSNEQSSHQRSNLQTQVTLYA